MRNIKYKAYIKDYKQIADVEILELLPNGEVQSVVIRDNELNEEVYRVTQGQFALMEFIEHWDIEGNEVYTGHIVSFLASGRNYIGVVEWDNSSASYTLKTKDHYNEYFNEVDNLKVLGNIYENKELLNE